MIPRKSDILFGEDFSIVTELSYTYPICPIAVAELWRRQCDLSLWEIQRRKLIEVSFPISKDLAMGYHFGNLLSSGLWRKVLYAILAYCFKFKKINY